MMNYLTVKRFGTIHLENNKLRLIDFEFDGSTPGGGSAENQLMAVAQFLREKSIEIGKLKRIDDLERMAQDFQIALKEYKADYPK